MAVEAQRTVTVAEAQRSAAEIGGDRPARRAPPPSACRAASPLPKTPCAPSALAPEDDRGRGNALAGGRGLGGADPILGGVEAAGRAVGGGLGDVGRARLVKQPRLAPRRLGQLLLRRLPCARDHARSRELTRGLARSREVAGRHGTTWPDTASSGEAVGCGGRSQQISRLLALLQLRVVAEHRRAAARQACAR